MDHADHVALIRGGILTGGASGEGATWADIGAGTGAFTLALADLLGPGGRIIAVDRDARALRQNVDAVAARYPETAITARIADLTGVLDLPPLDGLVAANSLHFVPRDRQVAAIRGLAAHLRPGRPFVVVEYDTDHGTPWVPHPFSSLSWERLAAAAGLETPVRLHRVPSRFLGGIYGAVARTARSDAASRSSSAGSL